MDKENPPRNGNAAQPLRLSLPAQGIRTLRNAGIYCQPGVALVYQRAAKQYSFRAVESGGAIRDAGHYAVFCDDHGQAWPWLQPVFSVGANGLHAIVIAPVIVSLEMFRIQQTYEILIARHTTAAATDKTRPERVSEIVYRGRQGYLSLELWGVDCNLAGQITPSFYTRSGEPHDIPARFVQAARAATQGVNTIGCERALFAHAPAETPCGESLSATA